MNKIIAIIVVVSQIFLVKYQPILYLCGTNHTSKIN